MGAARRGGRGGAGGRARDGRAAQSRVASRRSTASLGRAVASVRKGAPAAAPGGMTAIIAFLEPLRLERCAEKCADAGYSFVNDLLAAEPDELDLLFASLRLRKPEERRFRETVDAQKKQTGQKRGGMSRRSDSQSLELVAELLAPLQLGRYAVICTSKGYSFAKDVIGSDDDELAQLLLELAVRAPEERRLRNFLGRPPVPADPVMAAAQKERVRVAIEEARVVAEEAEAAELEAQKKAEEKAVRKAAKKALRQEYKAKVIKFMQVWMGNNLRGIFELWRAAVALRLEYRAKVAQFVELWMGKNMWGSFELWKAVVVLGKSERAELAEQQRIAAEVAEEQQRIDAEQAEAERIAAA